MNTSLFTKEHFIEKIKSIPDENWISDGQLVDMNHPEKGCILYHLGVKDSLIINDEARALGIMLKSNVEKIENHLSEPVYRRLYNHYDKEYQDTEYFLSDVITCTNDSSPNLDMSPKEMFLKCLEVID